MIEIFQTQMYTYDAADAAACCVASKSILKNLEMHKIEIFLQIYQIKMTIYRAACNCSSTNSTLCFADPTIDCCDASS